MCVCRFVHKLSNILIVISQFSVRHCLFKMLNRQLEHFSYLYIFRTKFTTRFIYMYIIASDCFNISVCPYRIVNIEHTYPVKKQIPNLSIFNFALISVLVAVDALE